MKTLKNELLEVKKMLLKSIEANNHNALQVESNKMAVKKLEEIIDGEILINGIGFRACREPEEYLDIDFFENEASAMRDDTVLIDNAEFLDYLDMTADKGKDSTAESCTNEDMIEEQCGALALSYIEECQTHYKAQIEKINDDYKRNEPKQVGDGWYFVKYELASGELVEVPAQLKGKHWHSLLFSGVPLSSAAILSPILVKKV